MLRKQQIGTKCDADIKALCNCAFALCRLPLHVDGTCDTKKNKTPIMGSRINSIVNRLLQTNDIYLTGLPMLPPEKSYSICCNFAARLDREEGNLPPEPEPEQEPARGKPTVTPAPSRHSMRLRVRQNGYETRSFADLASLRIIVDNNEISDGPIPMEEEEDDDDEDYTEEGKKTRRSRIVVFIDLIEELMGAYRKTFKELKRESQIGRARHILAMMLQQ